MVKYGNEKKGRGRDERAGEEMKRVWPDPRKEKGYET